MDPPVVITGMGLVSALGLSRGATWRAVREGACGIGPVTAIESPPVAGAGGGQAAPLVSEAEREVGYLRHALDEAIRDANLHTDLHYAPARCGAVLGTTLGGMRSGGRYLRTNDARHLREFLAAATLRSALAGRPVEGFTTTTCAACGSGLVAIGLARDLLAAGVVDLVLAGGYDTLSEYVWAGFASLRLVSDRPPRPFSRERAGMNLGEGYGIVVMERADGAHRRGAVPRAVVAGCCETSDAHHLTQPHPEGDGAARAIAGALADAGLAPGDIDLISAHATATPDNDRAEHAALSRAFGDRLPAIGAVAFKSHLGHTLGGAGAVELVLAATALEEGVVPPTANLTPGDLEFEIGLVGEQARPAALDSALVLSLGFGGTNAATVVRSPGSTAAPYRGPNRVTDDARDPVITGIGCVLPGLIGNRAFVERLAGDDGLAGFIPDVDQDALAALLDARRVRRMCDYVKLLLAASTLALRDAAVDDIGRFACSGSAVLGSAHGSSSYTVDYYGGIVRDGMKHANPMLFAEGVPNVASAHLSLMLGLRGSSQTIIGSRTAGLDALGIAAMRVRRGATDRVLVGAAEEQHIVVDDAYRACGLHADAAGGDPPGFVTGWGAVALIVESRAAASARGVRRRARVDAVTGRHAPPNDRSAWPGLLADALGGAGAPAAIVGSMNDTWIDQVELEALRRVASSGREIACSRLYGRVAETFAVTPLAGIAAVLLAGRLPSLAPGRLPDGVRAATGDEPVGSFGVLGSDFNGDLRVAALTREDHADPATGDRLRGSDSSG